ncbi:MAG: MFS transporter [Bacteroidaceae bacterium]|nr:MFS transporter [Bacteroidaceae bacterium]
MEMMGRQVDDATAKRFKQWQMRSIIGTMIGYAIFYIVRKNLSMAIPGMEADPDLGFTKTDLGIFLTMNGVVYGISKLVNGFVGDRVNARWFMMLGLAMCAICNFVFGMSSTVWLFGLMWVLNGWFQGTGYPPCARILCHWVHPKQLATKMSVWNTSHSIGAFVALVLCGYIVSFGWRWCFYIPAIIAMLGVVFIFFVLRDTPTSVGLPEIAVGKMTDEVERKKTNKEFRAILMKRVFKNPFIWILSIANFFIYTVRFAFLDWGPTMFQQWLNVTPSQSGWMAGGFEIFGLLGMLLSGWACDKYFHGKAARVSLICTILTLICVGLLWMWKSEGLPMVGSIIFLFGVGFFIYGPQALIGIAAANIATKEAAASAVGLTGLFAYASTVLSGWGFGYVADHYGWNIVFISLLIAAVIGTLVLGLVWKAKANGYDD